MYFREVTIARNEQKSTSEPRIKLEFDRIRVGGNKHGSGRTHSLEDWVTYPTIEEKRETESFPNGGSQVRVKRYLVGGQITAPTNDPLFCMNNPDHVLVLCHVDSGLGSTGNAWISAGPGVCKSTTTAYQFRNPDLASYASKGKVAEILALMVPEQYLSWKHVGTHVHVIESRLTYLGRGEFDYGLPQRIRKTG